MDNIPMETIDLISDSSSEEDTSERECTCKCPNGRHYKKKLKNRAVSYLDLENANISRGSVAEEAPLCSGQQQQQFRSHSSDEEDENVDYDSLDEEDENVDYNGFTSRMEKLIEKMKKYKICTPKPKTPFTDIERRIMILYIMSKNGIAFSKTAKIWKQMIEDGILVHRTYHSLYNQYRRTILFNIKHYKEFINDAGMYKRFKQLKRESSKGLKPLESSLN